MIMDIARAAKRLRVAEAKAKVAGKKVHEAMQHLQDCVVLWQYQHAEAIDESIRIAADK